MAASNLLWSCRAVASEYVICHVRFVARVYLCAPVGGKATGSASSRGKGTNKTDVGNGINEVSDEDSDEDAWENETKTGK